MEEKEFFRNNDLLVTNARFVVGETTYAMSNITSVKTKSLPYSLFWQKLFGGFAALMLLSSVVAPKTEGKAGVVAIMLILLIVTICSARRKQKEYEVALVTTAKEIQALKSANKEEINSIVKALNEAIIFRG